MQISLNIILFSSYTNYAMEQFKCTMQNVTVRK